MSGHQAIAAVTAAMQTLLLRAVSDDKTGRQTVGDRFVLLDDDSVRQLDLPLAAIGSAVRIMATGIGDISGPVEQIVTIDGRSVLPPSPVHLVATDGPDGGAALSWIRRSRGGWRWLDGADAPLVEESEDYRVVVTSADGSARDVETAAPVIAISAAERALGPVNVAVSQRGIYGASPAATLQIDRGA